MIELSTTLRIARFSQRKYYHRLNMSTSVSIPRLQLSAGRKNQVIILAGATSAGKSKVALEMSRHLMKEGSKVEIIVADSVQIYRYLDIGSNKPSVEEQAEVPHHLVDICDPHELFSGGSFVRSAIPVIYEVLNRGNVPVVVGGSTMWLQWLVHGMPDAPKPSLEVIREANSFVDRFEKRGAWDEALEAAKEIDPVRVPKVARNDWYRMRRYIEVALSLAARNGHEGGMNQRGDAEEFDSGEEGDGGFSDRSLAGAASAAAPLNEAQAGASAVTAAVFASSSVPMLSGKRSFSMTDLDLRCFFLSEEREQLYRTIDSRCVDMVRGGLLQEVAGLMSSKRLSPNDIGAKAIGYRQAIDYLCRSNWKPLDFKAFDAFIQ